MDQCTFEACLREFWHHLKLPEPVFSDHAEVILSIDEEDVVLRHGVDGNVLVVEVEAGELGAGTALEYEELKRLLKVNLALCTFRNTVTVLDQRDGIRKPRVFVRGFYPYRDNDLGRLSDMVSDVMSSAETLRAVLAGSAHANRRIGGRTKLSDADGDDMVILNL